MEHHVVNLETLNSGAVIDLFEEEFGKLLKNVADNNTEPTKVRSVTIKVSIKPSKDRSRAETLVAVTSTLAPLKPNESSIVFSSDGELVTAYTVEHGKQQELGINVVPFVEQTAGGSK